MPLYSWLLNFSNTLSTSCNFLGMGQLKHLLVEASIKIINKRRDIYSIISGGIPEILQ